MARALAQDHIAILCVRPSGVRGAMQDGRGKAFSRRDLLSLIGTVAGSAAMYHAMTSLGFAVGFRLQGPDQA